MEQPEINSRMILSVKRMVGLGNIFLLLPVLDKMSNRGYTIELVTKQEWVSCFQQLRPHFKFPLKCNFYTIDLDILTKNLTPKQHRTDEFAQLLDVEGPFGIAELKIPLSWKQPFWYLKESIALAPEATNLARQWPLNYSQTLAKKISHQNNLTILGVSSNPIFDGCIDLRGKLTITELLGVISNLSGIICMDSGILHIATSLGVPCLAIFGGIEPSFRVREFSRVIIVKSSLDCCPCNKNETCLGKFHCLSSILPEFIESMVAELKNIHKRQVYTL